MEDRVICINKGNNAYLTVGREYRVKARRSDYIGELLELSNDEGWVHSYRGSLFKSIEKEINMKQNIQNREFIVGSVGVNGLSFSAFPSWHPTEAKAKAEAQRLAQLHTDKTFIWIQVKGGAKAVQIETF